MGYPTTVDIGAVAQKTGLAQISGGALQWGIPGTIFVGSSTYALSANVVFYQPFPVLYTHTMTAWELEVTTGPGGAANIRVGLYLADGTLQPTGGAPIYDSGSIAVAQSFTGIKTATGLSVTLLPGNYLVAVNVDTAMTLRTFISPTQTLVAALGASPMFKNFHVAQTYGAFPNPGTAWTADDATGGSQNNLVAWQWTE